MTARGRIEFGRAATALFQLDAPTAVSAGAGSGKTTALVELCARLLSGEALGTPCAPAEIAAITFTEKAAEELAQRLRGAVAERARAACEADPGSEAARAWLERLDGLERLSAGTIHGFCGRLLREHAPEAGLDPEFAVADEERSSGWLTAAARAATIAALDAGRPAARTLAAGLGAAGARGGLAGVVAELVRARATRGDIGPLVPAPARPADVDAARARLLAAAEAIASSGPQATGAGARDLVEAVRRALDALAPDDVRGEVDAEGLRRLLALGAAAKGKRLGKADGPLRELKDALAAAAEELGPLAAEGLAAATKEELCLLVAEAEARYAATKRAARAVDFDDLLVRARDLLRHDGALRAELRARYRALLVDEYQDVNGVQQELFELLSGPGGPAGPLLVAVGDLKQSIYRFRGADVAVFARLIRRLEAGDGRVLHLSDNHRSAPAVVELVNEVFARCMRPPDGAPPRDDEIRFSDADRLVPRRPEGARPACELLEDHEDGNAAERRRREAGAIARRIRAVVSGAAGVAVRERGEGGAERVRRPRLSDVAILFRRLTQIGEYERALRAAGIPYRLARGGGFYQAPEVRDLGELLATLADPSDAIGWAAVLRSPMCGVSDATLFLLARAGLARLARVSPERLAAEVARALGEGGAGALAPEAAERAVASVPAEDWARLTRLLDAWRELHALRDRLAPDALLTRAVERLDLDAVLLAGPDGERRAVNVAKAIALAARFGSDGGTAAELARHLRAQASRPPREPEAEVEAGDAVALLTVHQAKGLEWPVVFVPDLGARPRSDARRALLDAEGRLCAMRYDPAADRFEETASVRDARAHERRAAAAESRRLLYVAMTRARDRLVLSGEASNGAESWRGLVEVAAEARAELVRRIALEEAGSAPACGPPVDGDDAPAPAEPPAVAPPRLAGAPRVAAVRVAVTELAEYARCPRRHLLGRVLGLPEPHGARGAPADDPGRATARGTLAHAMLAEADLAAPPLERRAQLAAAAARRGYDPRSPGVRRILGEVARFANAEGGRALAEAARDGRLRREVPFLLRLPSRTRGDPSVYLVGAIDALMVDRRARALTVVDYKYATWRPDAADRYRLQLLAYVLAARRAHPDARVRARLQFLRGDCRAVDVTPGERELTRFAADAPRLAWEAFRGDGDRPPAELGRDEPRCRAEACGYVSRCYPPRRG
ncbi:exodeoxyribonuclease V subunit beta [Anaeromyxobacter sp. Fw109-5]|uniref:UvrD-helicase domain-containing protein n=1 Tax=Anaeromyxobacter sp. (strain Fw109-5) TaxID=404589 RepID=UPI000158A46F|nr:UvrD-helicase domain-containing protein [Anaeromyxobacter sp. Fw109-5]ABS25564.1 UvrD/REP helicase [Anaeromyxobacter sp. Fw109-5]